MKDREKDVWRAYLSELSRCVREARHDLEQAQDRWDDFSRDAPDDVREEFE